MNISGYAEDSISAVHVCQGHSGAARARDKEKEKHPERVSSFLLHLVPHFLNADACPGKHEVARVKFDQEFDFQGNVANNYSCATRICCNMHLKCMLWCRFKRLDQISYSTDHKNGCAKSIYKCTYLALAFDNISPFDTGLKFEQKRRQGLLERKDDE